ncbi:MAG: hypothetical protein K8H86_15680, partial [Ignavibacteriaceae bacterium]|nr:hypothetical protein [Ignavibacteriaceae bacterium]
IGDLRMRIKKDENRPLLLIVTTVLLVMLISFIPEDFTIGGYTFKPIDLFIDIKPDSIFYSSAPIEENSNSDESKYQVLQASADYKQLFASLENYAGLLNNSTLNYSLMEPGKKVPLSGNVRQMKYFFDALKNTKTQKVRVADYGDSGNEGDFGTADIRTIFQKQFGGHGVGFMNITAQDISFRMTTKHSFSDNWNTYSALGGKNRDVPFGINGFVSVPENGGAWVKYEAQPISQSSKSFTLAKLFYANAKKSTIRYSFDNGKEETVALNPGKGVQELLLDAGREVKTLKITATAAGQAHFFGVSLESGNGVYVDNFAWRGNTGISFKDIPENYKKDFDRLLNYKLIILTFGANMLAAGNVNFNSYRSQMTDVIKELQSSFPSTSILLVGLGDKVIKHGSRFVTSPDALKMIETQKKIAEDTGVTFWDKFEAMGGMNSMVEWVNHHPPYASKDYGHLTYDGAKYLGEMISDVLINANEQSKNN